VVPFSALAAFFGYASFVTIDTSLLIACTAGAVTGAAIGNRLLHEKLSPHQVKKLIAAILYLLAFRMLWGILA